MKIKNRTAAFILGVLVLATAAFSGCGKSAPTEADSEKYVKAVLDLMCTGEYDPSVKFPGEENGSMQTLRDRMIDEVLSSLSDVDGIDDDVRESFWLFFVNAFAKCRYSVGEAVRTDDEGNVGYDVPVTIEPLKVFDGASEALADEVEALKNDTDRLKGQSEDEIRSMIFDAVFSILESNLENPDYDAPVEITIHYGLLDPEKQLYGIDDRAGDRLGEMLFSTEGLE